jgi:hypothetical protein
MWETLDSYGQVEQMAEESIKFSEGSGNGHTFAGNLPIYMNCPYCCDSGSEQAGVIFAGSVSQLQQIFLLCTH